MNSPSLLSCQPSSAKATTIYARPGVNVDAGRSGDREVTLAGLGQKSTGRYRCEVSTEAPSFATVSNYGDMVVVGESAASVEQSYCGSIPQHGKIR